MTTATLAETAPQVIELRRYLMRPGRRDELVALFEREFIETQADAGMQVLGIFTEPDQPDRFTWLRGFADMATRATALAAFYGGPVWATHRSAANATMLDSDDVLLLRPCPGLPALASPQRLAGRRWCAWVLPLAAPADDALREAVAAQLLPAARAVGAEVLAVLETEPAENNFPRLPVRTDGPKLVLLLASAASLRWQPPASWTRSLSRRLAGDPAWLNLEPTPRSPRA